MAFQFKQFSMSHERSTMKIGTDAVLLGAWTPVADHQQVLDVGTGSGVIALMLAQRADADILAIDIDPNSVQEARQNFIDSPWSKRLKALHTSLQQQARESHRFDLIVSNPPFFQNSLKTANRLRNQARHNDHLSFQELAHSAAQLLAPEGTLCVVYPTEEAQHFIAAAQVAGLHLHQQLFIHPRVQQPAKRILMAFKKNYLFQPQTHHLPLRSTENQWSREYTDLTQSFYLQF